MIADLTHRQRIVLATGGGAVMRAANRQCLQQRGIVIYLYTPVAMQLARTARDRNRPLLQTDQPEIKLQQLLDLRDPFYREIAHYIVPTLDGSAKDLAQKIIHLVSSNTLK